MTFSQPNQQNQLVQPNQLQQQYNPFQNQQNYGMGRRFGHHNQDNQNNQDHVMDRNDWLKLGIGGLGNLIAPGIMNNLASQGFLGSLLGQNNNNRRKGHNRNGQNYEDMYGGNNNIFNQNPYGINM